MESLSICLVTLPCRQSIYTSTLGWAVLRLGPLFSWRPKLIWKLTKLESSPGTGWRGPFALCLPSILPTHSQCRACSSRTWGDFLSLSLLVFLSFSLKPSSRFLKCTLPKSASLIFCCVCPPWGQCRQDTYGPKSLGGMITANTGGKNIHDCLKIPSQLLKNGNPIHTGPRAAGRASPSPLSRNRPQRKRLPDAPF